MYKIVQKSLNHSARSTRIITICLLLSIISTYIKTNGSSNGNFFLFSITHKIMQIQVWLIHLFTSGRKMCVLTCTTSMCFKWERSSLKTQTFQKSKYFWIRKPVHYIHYTPINNFLFFFILSATSLKCTRCTAKFLWNAFDLNCNYH